MGTRKSTVARILILGCAGLFCLGATLTWSGNGNGDWWDVCGNWDACATLVPYPASANDDARIPENSQSIWQVALATVSNQTELDVVIDDLTIRESVEFIDDGETAPKVTCDTLVIHASGPGASITVEMTQNARIETQ